MLNELGLRKRAELIQAIRAFFINREYVEVDTPARLPVVIPEAHNLPVESGDHILQTSPEICMKRVLAETGCRRIFQICKCYRKNERGDRHLPEFTMLEWYRAQSDYNSLMTECEDFIIEVAEAIGRRGYLSYQRTDITLEKPWARITVSDAFSMYSPVSMAQALEENIFDEILCTHIEPRLGMKKPVFLYDYPAELGALARKKTDNPSVAERFEVYVAGLELANGFSELTDPKEQRQRFEQELKSIEHQGRSAGRMPEKFLKSLVNMPEAAGIALGVDRLAMILFDLDTIDKTVLFVPEDL
ncbi:MAG: EF-P lysine aminoacylase GenX [Deltaproteobacteria bacterium]|jgi:lysyl-tRNA synthetase class 2|nr:EF-P lysine aminoacylase GenX [Deltaproteobacteria bacterium]